MAIRRRDGELSSNITKPMVSTVLARSFLKVVVKGVLAQDPDDQGRSSVAKDLQATRWIGEIEDDAALISYSEGRDGWRRQSR